MAHIGKLLGRLNPKTQSFTDAAGGIPELTPQDVAAALAFVPAGLGRELLCYVWWPNGASYTRTSEAIMDLLAAEWRRRESDMLDAMLMVATPDVGRGRAQDAYRLAHDNRWPSWVRMEHGILQPSKIYARIMGTVLTELRYGHHGDAGSESPKSFSIGERAAMMGIDESAYKRNGAWGRPYEWLLDRCASEVGIAQRQFGRAVA